jgi:CRISPR-associated endonuclease/helicase Cas3
MTTIWLQGGTEKIAKTSPYPSLKRKPLYHQVRTLEALRDYHLVMNTYNTGTGKTVASLLHLFEIDRRNKNVLFIAPTNALLAQHAQDIEGFVEENDFNFKVLRVTAAEVRALNNDLRSGEILQRFIRNYLEFDEQATSRQPIILVVNPDIFYYALYFQYGAHDRRNVFERFLTAFDYIVVDEFHYYDAKQLSNFLFAFALFDQFGYFEVRNRRICLLSATPATAVVKYLDRLFESHWVQISPDNEPPESDTFETVPTLTPLDLTVQEADIVSWTDSQRIVLKEWIIQEGLDGALISNSLARINEAYATLRGVIAEEKIGRITGPEPPEIRAEATFRNLILATPTVDIGYNFVKSKKDRQNVDFVICDARYGDELVQRIGRAGRILGKTDIDQTSKGVALLSPEAAQALAVYDGQTLSRREFASIILDCDPLPPKHTLTGYIRTHAITESFWPIYQVGKMLPVELQNEVDDLFERIRSIFAPSSRRGQWSLWGFFKKLEKRQQWLKQSIENTAKLDEKTLEHVHDWLTWLNLPDPESWLAQNQENWRDGVHNFVQSQVAVTKALFSFRDAFQGPIVIVYDPAHIFSTQSVNSYDLFHFIRNYHLSPPLSLSQFKQISGVTPDLQGDFYFRLLKQREAKLILEFVYDSKDDNKREFERKWCGAPVALNGICLQVREYGGDMIAGELVNEIVTSLAEKHLTMLIVPPEDEGAMRGRLRGTSLWPQRLTVSFPDGSVENSYHALLGSAAFHAHAELWGHFLLKERLKPEAIII